MKGLTSLQFLTKINSWSNLSFQPFCYYWVENHLFSVAVGKLMELHGEGGAGSAAKATGDDTGAKVERADGYEPPIQETV